jgi:hypothetical protein
MGRVQLGGIRVLTILISRSTRLLCNALYSSRMNGTDPQAIAVTVTTTSSVLREKRGRGMGLFTGHRIRFENVDCVVHSIGKALENGVRPRNFLRDHRSLWVFCGVDRNTSGLERHVAVVLFDETFSNDNRLAMRPVAWFGMITLLSQPSNCVGTVFHTPPS